MSEETKPVVLRVYLGGELQTIKQFTIQQIVIGQSAEVQLPLNHKSVSVIHAAIEHRDTGYFICDLGSEGGTILNGSAILDAKLSDADEIKIGDFKIEFYVGVPKPKAPPVKEAPAASTPPPIEVKTEPPPSTPAKIAPPSEVVSPSAVSEKQGPPPLIKKPENVEPQDIDMPTTFTELKEPEVVTPKPLQPKQELPKNEVVESSLKTRDLKAPIVEKPAAPTASVIDKPIVLQTVSPVEKPQVTAPPMQLKPVILTQAGQGGVAERPQMSRGGGSGGLETYVKKNKNGSRRPKKVFAPESKYKKIDDFVKPSRGTVVEVLVAWKERIINTYHFSKPGLVTLGSHPEADIQIPLAFSKQRKTPLLKIDSRLVIMLAPEMTGEMTRQGSVLSFSELLKQNRMVRAGNIYQLALEQGEMMKIEMGELTIILRYVSEAPKPLIAPLLDLTASESVGVIFAVVLVAILFIYSYLYTPLKPLEADVQQDDPPRQALVIVKPPPLPKVAEASPTPAPTPVATPPPVKSTPVPKKVEAVAVKVPKKETIADEAKKKDQGKTAEVAPNKVKAPAKVVGVKRGGSIKTTDTAAAQVQSKPKKDLTKSGVFSVFGGGGKNNELSKETAGAGEIAGLANSATGKSGLNEHRSGEGLGTIQDTGRGGNGTAAVGRPDVKGGNGRGTGNKDYGSGGIGGERKGVKIQPGGTEESFSGTIDREAIRRVIQANLKAIKACYEKQLNRRPDLFGKLVIEWDIGDGGRVMRARVKSSELSEAEVGSCVVTHLKTWTFPTPPTNNEVTVSFPFFFSN